jgi:pantetheine-phosphate adenylyltransferase
MAMNEQSPGKKAGSLFEPPYGTLKDYPLSYNSRGVNTVKAIYPGSFDPVTNGHLDLIARGSRIFDHLVVAILRNSSKNPLFTVEERVEMLTEGVASLNNVSIATFDGLLVDFAREQQAQAVVRGIRAISDYEYEFQMALMNRRLAPELETIFLMPDGKYSFVSSRLVKEVFELGGSVEGLVPKFVIERLKQHKPGSQN